MKRFTSKKKSGSKKEVTKDSKKQSKFKLMIMRIERYIKKNPQILKGLSSEQYKQLQRNKRSREHGATAERKPPIKNFKRYGGFYHLVFNFPGGFERHTFIWGEKNVNKYAEVLKDFMNKYLKITPNHIIGWHMVAQCQVTDDQSPELHFHVLLSKHMFHSEDEEYLHYFKTLPDHLKPAHSLYFLHTPFNMNKDEFAEYLEDAWRSTLSGIIERKIPPEHRPLITVTTKEEQEEVDRAKTGEYIRNSPRHVFKNMEKFKFNPEKQEIRIFYDNPTKAINAGKPIELPMIDFIKRYLIDPNRSFGKRWYGRGFFHHRSGFGSVIDAACELTIDAGKNNAPCILNLSMDEIIARSLEFRQCVQAGDKDALDALIARYGRNTGDGANDAEGSDDDDDFDDLLDLD